LIVGWCGRFLFFVVPRQFSQDIGDWPENQILIPDWTYFHCCRLVLSCNMWKLLGYSEDNKDSNSANQAPEPITMVRSRAVVDDGRKAADGADPGDDFILSQFDAHGIKFAHPKGWGIVEEQRKIFLFHPTDRSISLNIIIGITAPGTDLDELTSQAVEMYTINQYFLVSHLCFCFFAFVFCCPQHRPRKLMANGALDSSSAPLAVEEVTMLGKPARSLSYKIKVSPLRCNSMAARFTYLSLPSPILSICLLH